MTHYEIPCPHDLGQATTDETVPDYYPLSKEEIADLLFTAKEAVIHHDIGTASSIQCRFDQGIVGQECPRAIEGGVARRTNKLDHLFVEYIQGELLDYSDQEVVEELYALMRG